MPGMVWRISSTVQQVCSIPVILLSRLCAGYPIPSDLATLAVQFVLFEVPRGYVGGVSGLLTKSLRAGVRCVIAGEFIDVKLVVDQLRSMLQDVQGLPFCNLF